MNDEWNPERDLSPGLVSKAIGLPSALARIAELERELERVRVALGGYRDSDLASLATTLAARAAMTDEAETALAEERGRRERAETEIRWWRIAGKFARKCLDGSAAERDRWRHACLAACRRGDKWRSQRDDWQAAAERIAAESPLREEYDWAVDRAETAEAERDRLRSLLRELVERYEDHERRQVGASCNQLQDALGAARAALAETKGGGK